jgi:hypothetical protein
VLDALTALSDSRSKAAEIFGPQRTEATTFGVFNQFETDTFTVTSFERLCVPAAKLAFQPVE